MTAAIPPPLKAADIARFALRAGQLEKAKPVVAYYCYYWISDQIISKGLHQADNECMIYTTNLMDKLEQMKSDAVGNDAITDDLAGQAYVEQFAQETFQRADNAMKANRVTRQTADTFQAAATFLDLGQIWGPLEPDIASQIKFAKYHALRIAKAIKAGEDPNLSNPAPTSETGEDTPLDPNDPEVQRTSRTQVEPDRVPHASVEEIPDEHDQPHSRTIDHATIDEPQQHPQIPSMPEQSGQNFPSGRSVSLSPPERAEDYYSSTAQPQVSPLQPPSADKKPSHSAEYFPSVPNNIGVANGSLPNAPPLEQVSPQSPPINSAILPPPAASYDSEQPPGPTTDSSQTPEFERPETQTAAINNFSLAPDTQNLSQSAPRTHMQPNSQPPRSMPNHPLQAVQHNLRSTPVLPKSQIAPSDAPLQVTAQVDEEAILQAQKHARWAISALNFEDVKTAVAELRGALNSLGA